MIFQRKKDLLSKTWRFRLDVKGGKDTVDEEKKGDSESDKYLENLKAIEDSGLNLSEEKLSTIYAMAEILLNEGFEPSFVAGVLGNIVKEANIGTFESSTYKTNPSQKPEYLMYMDKYYNYNDEFSGKNISEIGIANTQKLLIGLERDEGPGKFGLGCVQWTGDRTQKLLDYYITICGSEGTPTREQCIQAESLFIVDELKGDYKSIYETWCETTEDFSSSRSTYEAGKILFKEYEKPKYDSSEERGEIAKEIYEIMIEGE